MSERQLSHILSLCKCMQMQRSLHSAQGGVLLMCMCLHVTGGGAGIGLACVKALAQAGATVVAVDIDEQACRCSSPFPVESAFFAPELALHASFQQGILAALTPAYWHIASAVQKCC